MGAHNIAHQPAPTSGQSKWSEGLQTHVGPVKGMTTQHEADSGPEGVMRPQVLTELPNQASPPQQ